MIPRRFILSASMLTAMLCLGFVPAVAVASPASPPAPSGKATAPGTDLANYPKLPAMTVTPSAASGGSDAVAAVTPLPGGLTRTDYYTPARGLSAGQLYRALKARGVVGLRNPDVHPAAMSTTTAAAATGGCTYYTWGTAKTLCPESHWANNGYGHPQVYFVDHTGSSWPVTTATYTWNQTHGVDSVYVWGSCPGYSGTHCVNVNDANYGNSCWEGETSTVVAANGNFVDGQVWIALNDYNGTGICGGQAVTYAKNAAGYRQDACHEEGHALGLDHNSSTDSCIYSTIINNNSALGPDANDFSLLAWVYSTTH